MARKKRGNPVHGWVNVNKPVGVTSTQVVGQIRRALNAQKAGHGGTLDPLASGILPIALGEATKTVNFIQDAIKTYHFTVTWGEQRSTDDAEGDILETSDKRPTIEEIEKILPDFIGEIEQIPPQFSAVKIDGERAYDIARDGEQVEIKSRKVKIKDLSIWPQAGKPATADNQNHPMNSTSFSCTCGKGTYIRALARDIGQKLGCFGYISMLERTQVGGFTVDTAISLDFFQQMIDNPTQVKALEDIVLPLQTVLDDIPALALKDQEAIKVKNGNALSFLSKPDLSRLEAIGIDWKADGSTIALATYDGKAMAMIDVSGAKIQPVKVFNV
jgi:tRNA pseudouridine55 synthase